MRTIPPGHVIRVGGSKPHQEVNDGRIDDSSSNRRIGSEDGSRCQEVCKDFKSKGGLQERRLFLSKEEEPYSMRTDPARDLFPIGSLTAATKQRVLRMCNPNPLRLIWTVQARKLVLSLLPWRGGPEGPLRRNVVALKRSFERLVHCRCLQKCLHPLWAVRGPPGFWIRPKPCGDMGTTPPDGGSVCDVRQTPQVPIQTARPLSRLSRRKSWLAEVDTLMKGILTLLAVVEGQRADELRQETVWAESEKTFPRFVLLFLPLLFTPWVGGNAPCTTFMVVRRHADHPSRTCNPSRWIQATPGGERWQNRRFVE